MPQEIRTCLPQNCTYCKINSSQQTACFYDASHRNEYQPVLVTSGRKCRFEFLLEQFEQSSPLVTESEQESRRKSSWLAAAAG